MFKKTIMGLAAAAAMLCMSNPASAALLTETFNSAPCGFNTTDIGTGGNFTVTAGRVDVLSSAPADTGCFAVGGAPSVDSKYLDLHGTNNSAGGVNATLTSTLTFTTPGSYSLTFFWGNNGYVGFNGNGGANNHLQVSLGTALNVTLDGPTTSVDAPLVSSATLNFTVAGNGGQLIFSSLGNTNSDSGPLLDSISMTYPDAQQGGVPEPASFFLLLPGIAAIAWRLRRK